MKPKNKVEEIAVSMMSEACTDEDIIGMIGAVSDLEETDRDGRTLLIDAAAYGRTNVIKYLIDNGAHVNTSDKAGFTALHMATLYCDIPTISVLLENGANVNAKDSNGNTPMSNVGNVRALDVFRILIKHGADPYEKNNYGVAPCDFLAGYPDIVAMFNGEG